MVSESAIALAPLLPGRSVADLTALCSVKAQSVQPVEAVPLHPLLTQLSADYALGVMTNDAEQAARDQLARCGITALFRAIIGFDSGHGAKPDAAPLLAFARLIDTAPADIVMVGDSSHDLHAAKAAGCIPLGVLTGPAGADDLRAAGAEAVLDNIGQLPFFLAHR